MIKLIVFLCLYKNNVELKKNEAKTQPQKNTLSLGG